MGPFGGWEMPICYKGILAEHRHTRSMASVFDTTHMGEIALSGTSAARDVNRLLTRRVDALSLGSCRYGFLLNDDGGILDDLTCYRLEEDMFFLVINAGNMERNAAWIRSHASNGTIFEDRSPAMGKLDVQGPASRRLLEEALEIEIPEMKFFHCRFVRWQDTSIIVSRSGYTGEPGYELYLPAEHTPACWEALLLPGHILPAGLGARDTLRLEMAYPLYGHELSENHTPVAAARGKFIDLDPQHDFIGRAAVEKDLASGCERYLCGLLLSGRRAARAGDAIINAGGRVIGEITSGSLSPTLGKAIALAYVDAELTACETELTIAGRNGNLEAVVVKTPFLQK